METRVGSVCVHAHTHAHKYVLSEKPVEGENLKKQVLVRDHTTEGRCPLDLITVVIGDLGWYKLSTVVG